MAGYKGGWVSGRVYGDENTGLRDAQRAAAVRGATEAYKNMGTVDIMQRQQKAAEVPKADGPG